MTTKGLQYPKTNIFFIIGPLYNSAGSVSYMGRWIYKDHKVITELHKKFLGHLMMREYLRNAKITELKKSSSVILWCKNIFPALRKTLSRSDEDITLPDTHNTPLLDIQDIQCPITRDQTRQLNLYVRLFVSTFFMMLWIDFYLMTVLWLGTKERTRRCLQRSLESEKASKRRPSHVEAQDTSSPSPPWNPGVVCLRLDAWDTYKVQFLWSTYGWKDNFVELPIALVHNQINS